MGKNHEELAREYAEKYGIEEYHVRGSEFYYYMTFPAYGSKSPYTVKVIVNLETFSFKMITMKRVIKEGLCNTQ